MLRIERTTATVLVGALIGLLAGCDRPTTSIPTPTPVAKPLPTSASTSAKTDPALSPPPVAGTSPAAAAPLASPLSTGPAAPAAQAPAPDGFVRVVNTHCPVQTDHAVRRGMVAQEYAVEHRGRMFGMCCGDCVDYWKNLTDEERDELVAKVMPSAPK